MSSLNKNNLTKVILESRKSQSNSNFKKQLMHHHTNLPRVLCLFDHLCDREKFTKLFKDDFELIICQSDDEVAVYLNDRQLAIHALVLDQQTLSSTLPKQCKLSNPDCLVICLYKDIDLDSVVSLLDKGSVDKCFAKPYDSNLLRSEIFTAYMGLNSQTNTVETHDYKDTIPAALIVDDEVVATKFLKKQLEKMHCPCDILLADDAEQALDIFEQHKERIAIIISDQRMPGMQGNQLLTEIKKHQPAIIRMLTSAYEEVDIALNAVNEGKIYRYIKKPWSAVEFNETIKTALTEFQNRMDSLNSQQFNVTEQYDLILNNRKKKLFENLNKIIGDFSGQATLTYFFECLNSIKTLPPNSASLRASQDSDIESTLVSEFTRMILDKIQAIAVSDAYESSKALMTFVQEMTHEGLRNQHVFQVDMNQLSQSKLDLALIDCLRHILMSSHLELSSLEFSIKNGQAFLGTKAGKGIAIYKHLFSPQTQVAKQMLEQQCDVLTLIMLCHKRGLSLHIEGSELQLGLTMQLPCIARS